MDKGLRLALSAAHSYAESGVAIFVYNCPDFTWLAVIRDTVKLDAELRTHLVSEPNGTIISAQNLLHPVKRHSWGRERGAVSESLLIGAVIRLSSG